MQIDERLLHNVNSIMNWYYKNDIMSKFSRNWPNNNYINKDKIKVENQDEILRLFVYYGRFQQMKDETVNKILNQAKNINWWNDRMKIGIIRENINKGKSICEYLQSNANLNNCVNGSSKSNGVYSPINNGCSYCEKCFLKESEENINRTTKIGAIPVSYVLAFEENGCNAINALRKIEMGNKSEENIYREAVGILSRVIGIGVNMAGWFLRSICINGTDPDLAILNDKLGSILISSAMKVDLHVANFLGAYGYKAENIFEIIKELGQKCAANGNPSHISQALYAFDKHFDDDKIEENKPNV